MIVGVMAELAEAERPGHLSTMAYESALLAILAGDQIRWRALATVASLGLPDCWIGAGFVRNAVWDHLHLRLPSPPVGDIDVLWFDPERADPSADERLEARLRNIDPTLNWSVKNQARMYTRNGDAQYFGSVHAMQHWPEIATAVAARRIGGSDCEIAAPFGLDDLFGLVVRPTPHFTGAKHRVYLDRVRAKRWSCTWPRLRIETTERP
jgi:uncharacterized protein